jgi:hypothetical protein
MRTDKVEKKLSAIERLADEIRDQARALREELGREEPAEVMWNRMILEVLAEIDKRGGKVPRKDVLEIGEKAGYDRQGMAGFYQQMLELREDGYAYLTDKGKERLATKWTSSQGRGRRGRQTSASAEGSVS